MSDRHGSGRSHAPPRQQNLQTAARLGFEAVARQSAAQLQWLGAEPRGDAWRLPVLHEVLDVDVSAGRITTAAGRAVGPHWTILTLHYLAVPVRPEPQGPEVTFADLATARSYAGVYHARVIARLCATAGREGDRLSAAARGLGGRAVAHGAGDAAFDFDVFPRIPVRLIWHAPDEEFSPTATLLLPANIEAYFPAEDIVVLSECLVARLGGKPF